MSVGTKDRLRLLLCVLGGPDSSYRPYDRQVYWRNYWCGRGQCQKAAVPGSSNHGLAIAVDCPSGLGQRMLRSHGAKFGWSHYEGARVGEAWHWVFVGPRNYVARYHKDPHWFMTSTERRWVAEYVSLYHHHKNLPRRRSLRRAMTRQRKRVWHAAQGKGGWSEAHRRSRYNILKHYSN